MDFFLFFNKKWLSFAVNWSFIRRPSGESYKTGTRKYGCGKRYDNGRGTRDRRYLDVRSPNTDFDVSDGNKVLKICALVSRFGVVIVVVPSRFIRTKTRKLIENNTGNYRTRVLVWRPREGNNFFISHHHRKRVRFDKITTLCRRKRRRITNSRTLGIICPFTLSPPNRNSGYPRPTKVLRLTPASITLTVF